MFYKQLEEMKAMQEAMNYQVSPTWRDNGWDWYRAVWLETAEAVEHTNWKWWKKVDTDMDQLTMELVDIWHFILSAYLQRNMEVNFSAEAFITFGNQTLVEKLETLAFHALSHNLDSMTTAFYAIMYDIDMTTDELYALYVGKNTLNRFRQLNGYKTGGYDKIWNGLEDNVQLTQILAVTDVSSVGDYSDRIYQQLNAVYINREIV